MSSAYHPLTSFENFTQPIELERLGSAYDATPGKLQVPWKRVAAKAPSRVAKTRNFPTWGALALAGSALTVAISLSILLAINGKPIWPSNGIFNILQPASLLSAHMSLNAIFIEIAFQEGLNIAWWHEATKLSTTVQKLHEIWAVGHSSRAAFRLWRSAPWVSLAAVLVAVSPINGVILQASILTPVSPVTSNHTLTLPMVKQLDLGYSAYPAPTETSWGAYTFAQWFTIWKQVQFSEFTEFANYAWFGSKSDLNSSAFEFGYNSLAPYKAKALGAGWDMNCQSSQEPYNLEQGDREEVSGRIFNNYVSWSKDSPNTIQLYFLWKQDYSCVGNYEVRTCTLRAATIEYPIEISMNISGSPYKGPFYSLAPGSTRRDDRLVRILPVYEAEGRENTTFGGIAGSLEDYDSYYQITTWANGSYEFQDDGPLIKAIEPTFPAGTNAQCSLSFEFSLRQLATWLTLGKSPIDQIVDEGGFLTNANIDPSEILFERLRQGMFLASVYQGTRMISNCCAVDDTIPHEDSYYFQTVTASQTLQVAKYQVRWWLWGVSVALTWITCALVVPLFYGFWVLSRRTSLSPAETARLFGAPVLSDFDEQVDAKEVLEKVGSKKIHLDIRSNSMRGDAAAPVRPRLSPRAHSDYNISLPYFGYNAPHSPFPDGAWPR